MPRPFEDQIEEAERYLAIRLSIATKPGATVEDEWALERARNTLLQAELKAERAENMDLRRRLRDASRKDHGHQSGRGPMRQPRHQMSPTERAAQNLARIWKLDERGDPDPEDHQPPRRRPRMGGSLCPDKHAKPQLGPDKRNDRRDQRPVLSLPGLAQGSR